MDTCVRNGIYDEALDLHAFISRISLLHPDMPIVKLLAAQVSTGHTSCVRHDAVTGPLGSRHQPLHTLQPRKGIQQGLQISALC